MVEVEDLKYLHGFGNHFETEALEGALPHARNSPAKCAYGLIAEQFSGTPFTYSRHRNQRSWLYKIKPSCKHEPPKPAEGYKNWISNFAQDSEHLHARPDQFRWKSIQH